MERWRKNLNLSRQETSLEKEAHVNTRKIKINQKKDRKNRQDTKAKERVDIIPKYPILDI
tara:strand:+ start:368 stop:547 length:180 start_codon:yes stop_codon:yes gene_type:complete